MLKNIFHSLFSRSSRSSRPGKQLRRRLGLEPLEDRCTPTVTLSLVSGGLTLFGPDNERLDSVTLYQDATLLPGQTKIALGSGRGFDQSSTPTAQNPAVTYKNAADQPADPANANYALVSTASVNRLIVSVGGPVHVQKTTLTINNEYIKLKGHGKDELSSSFHHGVEIDSSTLVGTGSSYIELDGTGGAGTANNYGVYIHPEILNASSTAEVRTSGTGYMTITGRAGGGFIPLPERIDLDETQNIGVAIHGATVAATGGGNLTVTGWGGAGGKFNYGVDINVTHPTVQDREGTISVPSSSGILLIEGRGSGVGKENYGISVTNGSVVDGRAVQLKGWGGPGTKFNFGVSVYTQIERGYTYSAIVQADSAYGPSSSLEIEGHGGVHEGTLTTADLYNYGIDMEHNAIVQGKNAAPVTLTGYSAPGWWYSHGIVVEWGAKVLSGSGTIEMTGYGQGPDVAIGTTENKSSAGIVLFWSYPPPGSTHSYGSPTINSTSGRVVLTGFGGNGKGEGNHGLDFESTSQSDTTVMEIQGTTVVLVGHPGHSVGSWAIFIDSSVRLELQASTLTIVPEGGSLDSSAVINNAQAIEIIARLDFNLELPDVLRVDAPMAPVPVLRMLDHYAGDQYHEATYLRYAHDEAPNDTTQGYFLVTYPPAWGRGIERIDYYGMVWDEVVL